MLFQQTEKDGEKKCVNVWGKALDCQALLQRLIIKLKIMCYLKLFSL